MTRPTQNEAIERIRAIGDDPDKIHAVMYCGENDYAFIYLVAFDSMHKGNNYLCLRYVGLSKPDAYDNDGWMSSGMQMREVPGLKSKLPGFMAGACMGEQTRYFSVDNE